MFLELMTSTGDARLDSEGIMIPSGEYVAALYESYAADVGPTVTVSERAYANSAARLAEELWQRDLRSIMPEFAKDHMEW